MNILITGGASGLGESILKKMALDRSAKVYFTYSNSKDNATLLELAMKNTKAIHCDFRSEDSVDSLVTRIKEIDPDVLINNAYLPFDKVHFHKANPRQFADSFQFNIIPVIRITAECIQLFRTKKFGKIINITSSAILNKPPIGWSEYVACKAYIAALSKSWATENARFNITSNCISPAFMMTNFTSDMDERIVEGLKSHHPLKTLLEPAEVADTVAYFVGCSQQINGTHFVINGGADLI